MEGRSRYTQAAPRWYPASYAYEYPLTRLTPRHYLRKGGGSLGHCPQKLVGSAPKPMPPRAGAFLRRSSSYNPPFRLFYLRGDLPVIIGNRSSSRGVLSWKLQECRIGRKGDAQQVDLAKLDLQRHLPLFFDGIRDPHELYRFIATQGVIDMLNMHGAAVLPVIPQLILPIKRALETRDLEVVCTTTFLLQRLVMCSDAVGQALVPYLRQILPVINLFTRCERRARSKTCAEEVAGRNVADLVSRLLQALEQRGGPEAFKIIKVMIPSAESVLKKA